jgi:hypothetical protein
MLAIKPADGNFIRRLPQLENEIGEKPAQLLLQIEYWIRISSTDEINGKRWTYQSTPDIQKKAFPSWSQSTINRVIKKLETLELIHIEKFNKARFDKTRWFSLNAVGIGRLNTILLLDDLCTSQNDLRSTQNDARTNQNDLRSTQNDGTIPETPTKISALNPASNTPPTPARDVVVGDIQTPPIPEKSLDEIAKPSVKVDDEPVVSDDTRGILSPPDGPNHPVALPPPSPDDCEVEELQAFFTGCTKQEIREMLGQHGADKIYATIKAVVANPNTRDAPALARWQLGYGVGGQWRVPRQVDDNKSIQDSYAVINARLMRQREQDSQRYITGAYAEFIEH